MQQLLMRKVAAEWPTQHLDHMFGVAAHRYQSEILAVAGRQAAVFGATERVRLFENGGKHRGEIAR